MARHDDFYIGYLPQAPKRISILLRRTIIGLGVCVCVIAILLAYHQLPFSLSSFEYGKKTQLLGYLYTSPVPYLSVPVGSGGGRSFTKDVLLVGFGKAGVDHFIDHIEKTHRDWREGTQVTLTGTLIYGDGKALLQVEDSDNLNLSVNRAVVGSPRKWSTGTPVRILGEVVDPKCYFGVMKPGEGKAHRSCAIRCIAGGIPPVFHAADGSYYVLLDEEGAPINQQVLPLVGDLLSIEGDPLWSTDMKFLKVTDAALNSLALRARNKAAFVALEGDMTSCGWK